MTNKWVDKSWQKDFLNMKSHTPSDAKHLMGGKKGLKDAWLFNVFPLNTNYLRKNKFNKINSPSVLRRFIWI